MDNDLMTIEKELTKAEELVKVNNFDNCLQVIVTIYGLSISYLYKTYLGRLQEPEVLIDYLRDNKIKIYSCTFGKYIMFLRKTKFIDEVYEILNPDQKYKKNTLLDNLSEITTARNQVVHPESNGHQSAPKIDRQFVRVHLELLKLFLHDFRLIKKNDFKVVSKFETFNFQKIVGEVQLYESLNEVLNNEDIDLLDVTYLSEKIPQKTNKKPILMYWSKVNELIKAEKLTLRRVINFDSSDDKNMKLLWFLFNLFPKYKGYLNQKAFFSVFRTSNTITDSKPHQSINLINLIIMYNSKNPDIGHAWIFGSHPKIHSSNQEYLHLYGTNLSILRKIYNDFFNSGTIITEETIKQTLLERNSNLTGDNIREYIERISKLFPLVGIPEEDTDEIVKVYESIMKETSEEENIEFDW
ncbi:hypothetical protein [Evansella tamaricis]|uniref:Uncharacterized protein n=1 Tax=Evansella tamaricis TaxID=2069301 RepID=A0ABS6JKI0_9BACI|nr:hypothetical protein [Evansella tamaricis]MBU9712823.1 hypothetical protein [Evansella tamaricis]